MAATRFHPAVAAWFQRTFSHATEPQQRAWPAIADGRHTLIAAPTGSGKTLAAFLAAIDALVQQGLAGTLPDETQVVYISPLKALSNDIERNLRHPLAGIREELKTLGLADVDIRAQVRTGDTTQADRTAMRKYPPHIIVTTPESLYLLLTSESGRNMLATTRTVIVDEIHAVAGSKRGAHLALSLERLSALAGRRIARIGLSATQKPIEDIARFLVGADINADGVADCTIVDTGHTRERDLAIELPGSPLEAVMSTEVWDQVYDRLAQLIQAHRTTLVFVNTRRLAERVTRHLSERIGKEHVTSHHGSLAKESRLDAEQRLKHGELRALVATASLELGIDIGDVDLVCQLGSPRAISTFLQRVGRSGHTVGGTPKGRLFPQTRDELIECTALLAAVHRGELDRLRIPPQPLDVLAQQIVAEVASREWSEEELYERFRRAYPYRTLTRADYTEVVRMLADGFSTRRGRRGAYLHRDAINGQLRARSNARLTALTCGGAIPDNADYQVVLEPAGLHVGTLNEDFAVESLAGDIFQLGNTSYRILKIEPGIVRVDDAHGAPPSIPFWLGEAPARTDELSSAVTRLRADIDRQLGEHITAESLQATYDWLTRAYGLNQLAAMQIADYLAAAKGVLGTIPTQHCIVLERFFDETGGMQLVIHSPAGSRINRAWGLALRKRFCRKFNFELQAAATEDAIVLSLGETHSFPLADVAHYLHSASVHDVLVQALLDAPLFTTRWRWNASIALAVKRFRGGRRNPAPLQRMDAEDLIAVVFPDQIACAENLTGQREIPDHPLVRQTIDDCLHEAMDIDGLIALLRAIEQGQVQVRARDLPHPSLLAQEILNAKPYAYLDDAPLEERRTQAVMSRRWLDPLEAAEFGRLDPEAIARVRTEAWPEADNADELHDALLLLGGISEPEGRSSGWATLFDDLVASGRATRLRTDSLTHWIATEQVPMRRALHAHALLDPDIAVPAEFATQAWSTETALTELIRGRLQGVGPTTASALAGVVGVSVASIDAALLALESEGFAMRGQFTDNSNAASPSPLAGEGKGERGLQTVTSIEDTGELGDTHPHPHSLPLRGRDPLPDPSPTSRERGLSYDRSREAKNTPTQLNKSPTQLNVEWCERRLLARIHRYTVERLRAEIEPVTAADFLRFLFEWQGITAEPRPEGGPALSAIIEQLEGYEAACMAWEGDILPARMQAYDPEWLDSLCRAGRVAWTRLTPPKVTNGRERAAAPVRSTPIALLTRKQLRLWQSLPPQDESTGTRLSPRATAVANYLTQHGASFFDELSSGAGLLKSEIEEALRELVALGRVQADSFTGLRMLLLPADRRRLPARRRRGLTEIEDAGRWSLLRRAAVPSLADTGEVSDTDPHPHSLPRRGRDPLPVPAPTSRERGRSYDRNREAKSTPTQLDIEQVALTLLRRYGVVFRKMLTREADWLPSWYELLRVYRRLEARGEIRGGRFVAGFAGEQYALPEAISLLRTVRKKPSTQQWVSLSAADPLNLVGIVTPDPRVPALASNRILYRDGIPIAVQIGGETRFVSEIPADEEWTARNALLRPWSTRRNTPEPPTTTAQ